MTRKRLLIAVPLTAAVLLGGFALIGRLAERDATMGSAAEPGATAQRDGAAGMKALAPGATTANDRAQSAPAAEGEYAAAIPPASPASTHYLVRTGDLQLLVARHSLTEALRRITTMTTGMGGYVLSSYVGSGTPPWIAYTDPLNDTGGDVPAVSVEEPAYDGDVSAAATGGIASSDALVRTGSADGRDVPYGQVTVRVPSVRFDAAVARFSALGGVEQVSTSSTDVSDQMVDLKARLRHQEAVERRLLGFLDRAETVRAALAVQDRLDQTELTIEQLKGQLAALAETTSYGTITVSLRERGVPQPGAIDQSDTFAGAFVHSLHLIADGARVSAVALGALLPFAALLAVLGAVAWYVRRRVARRRPPRAQVLEG